MAESNRKILLTFLIAAASILSIYLINHDGKADEPPTCQSTAKNMRAAAKVELKLGADDEAIRSFLTRHKFEFSYNRFSNRYQAINRNVKSPLLADCAVIAYIYIDESGKYSKSEIVASYTAP